MNIPPYQTYGIIMTLILLMGIHILFPNKFFLTGPSGAILFVMIIAPILLVCIMIIIDMYNDDLLMNQ